MASQAHCSLNPYVMFDYLKSMVNLKSIEKGLGLAQQNLIDC